MDGLELMGDLFTEEEHAKLNAALLQPFGIDKPEALLGVGCFVLYVVLTQLQGRIPTRPLSIDHLDELLRTNKPLRNMLLECAQSGRFDVLRRLKMFRQGTFKLDESTTHNRNHTEQEDEDDPYPPVCTRMGKSLSAQDAWYREYHGDTHRRLLNNINALGRSATRANCVPFVQSSGAGKSRTVHEMAKLVFTIPFNLRNPDDRLYFGAWPPEDGSVWEYLCRSMIVSAKDGETLICLFFQTLFFQVAEEVKRVFRGEARLSPGEFALKWWDHLSSYRTELYRKVIQACRQARSGGSPWSPEQLKSNLHMLLQTLAKYCVDPESVRSNDVKIVLYFDEAHELFDHIPSHIKEHDIVSSALRKFGTAEVFTLFISTDPSLALPTPSNKVPPSNQRQINDSLWGPITETPFDCHPSFPIRIEDFTLDQLGDVEFLALFGRPLFWTMLRKKGHNRAELLSEIMDLARVKLLLSSRIDDLNLYGFGCAARLAILDTLIMIDYNPGSELAHKTQVEMVAGHMRIAFSIPGRRGFMHSGYPSEPFLAEAASRQMQQFLRYGNHTILSWLLLDNLKSGSIDVEYREEMVMRLLLRKAYMAAIAAEQPVARDDSSNFSKGCSFLAFLKALFAERHLETILDCMPANNVTSPRSLKDVFEHAVVRFTHYVKAAESFPLTARAMATAFLRGVAIIGFNEREGIDIAIPILLHKDGMLKQGSMSALVIQVKMRELWNGDLDEKHLDAFSAELDAKPYVTLVAKLNVKHPGGPSSKGTSSGGTRASARKVSSLKHPTRTQHPRYSIRASECTDAAYGVIDPNEVSTYAKILSDQRPAGYMTARQLWSDAASFGGEPKDRMAVGNVEPCEPVEVLCYEDLGTEELEEDEE